MIVCVCHRISDREIARHARAGMGFDDIQFELGVATQCGQCEGCARDVVARCTTNCSTANMTRSSLKSSSRPLPHVSQVFFQPYLETTRAA